MEIRSTFLKLDLFKGNRISIFLVVIYVSTIKIICLNKIKLPIDQQNC